MIADYRYKVLIIGDSTVGKTSLTIRYVSGSFIDDLRLTIGVDFYNKTLTMNEETVKFQLWDFAGEQRFRFLLPQYCKGANGVFFLYDITKPPTLEHLPEWISIVRQSCGSKIPILLIGSKADLDEYRKVPKEKALQTLKKYNLTDYIELSSKTGKNVQKSFKKMAKILIKRSEAQQQD